MRYEGDDNDEHDNLLDNEIVYFSFELSTFGFPYTVPDYSYHLLQD